MTTTFHPLRPEIKDERFLMLRCRVLTGGRERHAAITVTTELYTQAHPDALSRILRDDLRTATKSPDLEIVEVWPFGEVEVAGS